MGTFGDFMSFVNGELVPSLRGLKDRPGAANRQKVISQEDLVYPIVLANLIFHGIDEPHIWYGNTLTGHEVYGGLFTGAPALFDVILTNPLFGGKEGKDAQTHFAYKTRATQVLFL